MSRKSTNLPGSAGAILVAEDDADIGASLEMILGAEGYDVTVCGDGLEALERSRESVFDLVLTDFRMPGMGGLELLKHLRETHPLRPVILMTAPILLPIIVQAGFDPYWFAVVLTINMEIGLITPPVGLNLYVINGIAPDIPLQTILKGAMPYVLCMMLGIIILCFFPGIATWLPGRMMGVAL